MEGTTISQKDSPYKEGALPVPLIPDKPKTWSQTLKAMFSEGNTASCMRLCVTIIIVTYMFNWTYACVSSGEFLSIPLANLVGLLGVLGLKVGQKKLEK